MHEKTNDTYTHDSEVSVLAEQSKSLLLKLRRSIRSSIALSRRRDDWDQAYLIDHAAAFGQTLEWRNEELGWELGNLRRRAEAVSGNELSDLADAYLTHAASLVTLAEYINTESATAWRQTAREQIKLDVLGELHSQAILVTEEVLALLASGFPAGASARWRTLYELAIVATFIARSPKDTVRRYLDSHIVSLLQQNAAALKEAPSRNRRTRVELTRQSEALATEKARLLKTYGPEFLKPYGWAAKRLSLKRVTFADIERRVKSQRTRILPNGDKYSYKEASQHIHGERLSSLRVLAQVPGNTGLFAGKVLDPSLTQAATVWTLQHLNWTLAELVSRTQSVPEALYWGYVGHMFALDADTENWHQSHGINTGYLRRSFSVTKF